MDKSLLNKLRKVHTATISDILDSIGLKCLMSSSVKPLVQLRSPMVGTATTVLWEAAKKSSDSNMKTISESLLAIDRAKSGEIYVAACGGGPEQECKDSSLIGGLMSESMVARGLAGAISDTGIRDIDHIRSLGFPVFGRYTVPTSTISRYIIAQTGASVSCGGITVHQGDVIVGDNDGVTVFPPRYLKSVTEKALEFEETERMEIKQIRAGKKWKELLKKNLRI